MGSSFLTSRTDMTVVPHRQSLSMSVDVMTTTEEHAGGEYDIDVDEH